MVASPMTSPITSPHALNAVYGPAAASLIQNASVLVVGAGGVGCELVKNLAASAFGAITLIDLDTIDVSNLNRQFLFRKQHVGKSKAEMAARSISRMVPGTNVVGMVGNIKEARFGVTFFKRFDVVCNALDNLEARRHVNRMCLAAGVPLVESGSTGYVGQCAVIGKGYECYDCTGRPPQKSYAVCTIRSTPEKPVHCVVWAKFLYELIFGPDDDGNVLKDLDAVIPIHSGANEHHNSDAIANQTATAELNGNRSSHAAAQAEKEGGESDPTAVQQPVKPKPKRVRYIDGEDPHTFASRVCERVFVDDIKQQIKLKDLWKDRPAPIVFDVNAAADAAPEDLDKLNLLDQDVWSRERSAAVFKATLMRIVQKRRSEIGTLTFDKDDAGALMFVASASNLRSHSFGVALQSPFAVKGIAGNIVHAVATTNAIVGGLIVLEALKIIVNGGSVEKCLTTFVNRAVTGNRVKKILIPEPLKRANKNCFVCSQGQLHLSLDVQTMTLQNFVDGVLKGKLSILQPGVHVKTGDYHNTLYECGAGLEEDEIETYKENLGKTLKNLRVEDGSELVVEDFAQNLRTTLHVSDMKALLEEKAESERFSLDGEVSKAKAKKKASGVESKEEAEDVDDDSLVEVEVTSKAEEAEMIRKARKQDGRDGGVEIVDAEGVEGGAKKRELERSDKWDNGGRREVKRARGSNGDAVVVDGDK